MKIEKESPEVMKITVEEKDIAEWKGLDKDGHCFFKFDFKDRNSNQKIKVRVPHQVGYEMILLMREQLVKFMGNSRIDLLLNSAEKLVFQDLKEALVDDKDMVEKFALDKSIKYNMKHFKELGEKISNIELAQEENLIKDMALQKKLQQQEHLMLTEIKKKRETE